ncbi:MAG: Fic family protein [Fimbriimonadaceae bacterium]|nr:Fic family protein [Fimbriimonadaceae bacterium]
MSDSFAEITQMKAVLDSYRPLSPSVRRELDERLTVRLTYHSTAIEGNTLSQSETQIVLEKGVTIGGKSLIEHLEVIGHRDALEFVRALAVGHEGVTERTIREVHALVMRGQTHVAGGAYRSVNVVAAGTEFRYPDHLRVRELMEEYVGWWQSPSPLHPVEWASEAHLRFVTIHPFADGNGRVGRLLLNLALLRSGYPIAVIPVTARAEYISALSQAQNGGSPQSLTDLVLAAVRNSLRETLDVCETAG